MTRTQEARTAFDEYHDLVQALTDVIPNALTVASLIGRFIDAKLSESAAGRREPVEGKPATTEELERKLSDSRALYRHEATKRLELEAELAAAKGRIMALEGELYERDQLAIERELARD